MSEYLPPADAPTHEGLIAYGGKFNPAILREAYRKGIFPWPQGPITAENPILWFSPESRGILDFADLHIPKSLEKYFRREGPSLRVSLNQNPEAVMRLCQTQPRPGQSGTWILDEMIPAYLELQKSGEVLSLEVWRQPDILVGGIYGVLSERYFSGESMFHLEPNVSKIALWKMIEHLRGLGHAWMDVQMVTPVLEQLGAKYIGRREFLQRIGWTLNQT